MNKILKFKFSTKFSLDLFNNKKFVFINNIYLNKFSNNSIVILNNISYLILLNEKENFYILFVCTLSLSLFYFDI